MQARPLLFSPFCGPFTLPFLSVKLLLMKKFPLSDTLWDLWCICTVVGIWPRFIEPKLLAKTPLRIAIPHLPEPLLHFKILQLSDIHLNAATSDRFLKKITNAAAKFAPDLVVFTGDFLCYSEFGDKERLKTFLNSFSAPYGCYAILGNHDYAHPVSINDKGDYDLVNKDTSQFKKGWNRLFFKGQVTGKTSPAVKKIGFHQELNSLLKETPFQLLHNQTVQIQVGSSALNLTGLGDHSLGRSLPNTAFKGYNPKYPGIVLSHNPDTFPSLKNYPGDLVLSGHTHGGQINLPWVWRRLSLMEYPEYKSGYHTLGTKQLYVSTGLGNIAPFRWFAPPELVQITLERAS